MEVKLTKLLGRTGYIGIIFVVTAILSKDYFTDPVYYSFIGCGIVFLLIGLKSYFSKPKKS